VIWIALIGLTLIIVRGTIFEQGRRLWPGLLECSQCTGFWVGAWAGTFQLIIFGHGRALDILLGGFAISVLALSVDAALLLLLGGLKEEDGEES